MNARELLSADVWRLSRIVWVLIVAVFAAVFAAMTTPWLAPAGALAIVAALAYAVRSSAVTVGTVVWPDWLRVGAIGVAYILLSLLWTGDPGSSLRAAATLAVLLASIFWVSRALAAAPAEWLEHMTRALVIAFAAALLYLLVDELTGNAIKRILFRPFQTARWQDGTLSFTDGRVKITAASIKWNVPVVDFLLWPALLIAALQLGWRRSVWPRVAIVAAAAIVTTFSDHKTSLAALLVAAPLFVIAHRHARRVRQLLMVSWVMAFVVIIPLAQAAYNANVHLDGRVGPTMAARLILWHVTVDEFWKRPLTGVGADATRRIDNAREAVTPAPTPPGFNYPLRTGPHAHDIYLQSWYELGALGTIIFLLFGLAVLRAAAAVPAAAQPYVLATAATVMVTSAASFGLFETWFMGAYALSAMAVLMAVAYCRVVGLE